MTARTVTPQDLADRLAGRLSARARPDAVLVVGLTGSVASGKSTLAEAMAAALGGRATTAVVSTDGFLFPNAVLAERDLLARKGFPETYDLEGMAATIADLRRGSARAPVHSHIRYDIDPDMTRHIEGAQVVMLEGLGFSPLEDGRCAAGLVDLMIYLDAGEADLEAWFVRRFMGFWRAAEHDPASFYAQFRTMTEPDAETFARQVWTGINLPNLRQHIIRSRDAAHWIVRKDADHALWLDREA
ncbi:MAG: hypothetical protein ACK4RV_18990 [Caulobacter sp.]|jgi:type I pantothenate kinase